MAAVTVVPPPPAALAKARSHKPPPEDEASKRGESASSRAPKGEDETSRQQSLTFRPDLEFKPKSVNLDKSDLEQQIHLDEWLDQLAIEAKGVSGASEYDTPRIW